MWSLQSTSAQKFLKITSENGKVPYFLPRGEASHVSMSTEERTELSGVPSEMQITQEPRLKLVD